MGRIGTGLAGAALLLGVAACGDSSGPSTPDVAGTFEFTWAVGPATCDPPDSTAILSLLVILDTTITVPGQLRIEQSGGQFTMHLVVVNGGGAGALSSSFAGSLDAAGNFTLVWPQGDLVDSLPFSSPPRVFFDHLSGRGTGHFDLAVSPLGATVTDSVVEVFRDGSATAPVFATCTTPNHETWTRVSR